MAAATQQPRPSPTAYPTPPPTTSPKQQINEYQSPSKDKGIAAEYYNPSFQPQFTTPYPPTDIHHPNFQPQLDSISTERQPQVSLDTVPNGGAPNGYPPRSSTPSRGKPFRPDSPLAYSHPDDPPRPPSPRSSYRPSSRPSSRPMSPLHRSGTPLSPYNASRPKPRAGLQRAFLDRCASFGRWLASIGKKFPILTGLVTFIPIVIAGLGYRVYRAMGGDRKGRGRGIMATLFGALGPPGAAAAAGKKSMREHSFGDFRGFGGAKAEKGMFHGVVKMLQMMV